MEATWLHCEAATSSAFKVQLDAVKLKHEENLDVDSGLQLSDVLSSVEQGNEVILRRDGRAIAEVKRAQEPERPRKKRVLGLGADGKFYMSDDFDDELPDAFWLGEE